jgi:phosphoribosylanthranilate isomerase
MKVKVGRITNLSDARYCAGMGVDMLGFPVGARALAPNTYRQLIDWVSGPELVLEVDDHESDLEQIKENYPGHLVQIPASRHALLADRSVQFIVAMHAREWPTYREVLSHQPHILYVQVQAAANEISLVQEINAAFPVLWEVGDSAAIRHYEASGVAGLALTGGAEEKPGLRDYSTLADVLEQLEVDA